MGIYEEHGLTAYINANEWYTSQGGSTLAIRVDEACSHVHTHWSPSRFALARDEIKARLLAEEPRVLVRDSGPHGIRVNAATLSEGQEQLVARRLKEVLLG
jgi:hypothetical protein